MSSYTCQLLTRIWKYSAIRRRHPSNPYQDLRQIGHVVFSFSTLYGHMNWRSIVDQPLKPFMAESAIVFVIALHQTMAKFREIKVQQSSTLSWKWPWLKISGNHRSWGLTTNAPFSLFSCVRCEIMKKVHTTFLTIFSSTMKLETLLMTLNSFRIDLKWNPMSKT